MPTPPSLPIRMEHPLSLTKRRRFIDCIATTFSWGATLFVLFFLSSLLWTLLYNGLPGFTFHLFTHSMKAPTQNGGLANAIVGSIIQVGFALLLATPTGLLTGIYLAEYGGQSALARTVRFVSDMLLSVPSILVGLFVYLIMVAPLKHFSGFAGSLSLAILAMPIIVRTTENMLHLVPASVREAGIALGLPQWRVTLFICLRAAKSGIITGILLALARIAGETAPLLFTSLGNSKFSLDMRQPMASVTLAIYEYAGSAYQDWMQEAWNGALLITATVLVINIVVRIGTRKGRL